MMSHWVSTGIHPLVEQEKKPGAHFGGGGGGPKQLSDNEPSVTENALPQLMPAAFCEQTFKEKVPSLKYLAASSPSSRFVI